ELPGKDQIPRRRELREEALDPIRVRIRQDLRVGARIDVPRRGRVRADDVDVACGVGGDRARGFRSVAAHALGPGEIRIKLRELNDERVDDAFAGGDIADG